MGATIDGVRRKTGEGARSNEGAEATAAERGAGGACNEDLGLPGGTLAIGIFPSDPGGVAPPLALGGAAVVLALGLGGMTGACESGEVEEAPGGGV